MGAKCSYGQLVDTVFNQPIKPTQIDLIVEESTHPNMVGIPKGNERNIIVEKEDIKDHHPSRTKEIKDNPKIVIEKIDALEKDITFVHNMLTRFIVVHNEEMKDVK